MRLSIISLLLLWVLQVVEAQEFHHLSWCEGTIVLKDKSVHTGIIKYYMQINTVELYTNDKVEVYTARQVLYFEIYNKKTDRYRRIYSFPYELSKSYQVPVFFELLQEGEITLLCREIMQYRLDLHYTYFGNYTSHLTPIYKYFLLDKKGNITSLWHKKVNWLSIMACRKDEMRQFVKNNKLRFYRKSDLSSIVSFYNSFYEE